MRHLYKPCLFLLLLILFSTAAMAQAGLLDNNPPSVDYKNIESEHFNVIYQEGFYEEANRVLNTLETVYGPVSNSIGVKPRHTDVLLHNRTTIANGFVTLGPRRSEFFTTPAQDYNFLGTNDWLDLLAIHEFRHVAQFDKARTGVSNVFYYLFGENGLAAIAGISVPQWFWEGDAVSVETALTPGGRGRIPNFDLLYRTNLLTRGPWGFNKEYMQSFKHAVPDHYVTGYLLTTHVKREHGVGVWDDVLRQTYEFPLLPYRFGRKLKKNTGRNIVQHYKDMNEELETLWQEQADGTDPEPVDYLAKPERPAFTNYLYPQQLDNNMVVAMRTGLDFPSQLVQVQKGGSIKHLFTTGPLNDAGILSSGGNKVVWTEFRFHPRWNRENYSVVMSYDVETDKATQLTDKSRYSAAAISADGEQIVAVHNTLANKFSLHVLDAESGELLKELPNTTGGFLSMPRVSHDSKSVVTLRKAEWGKEVVMWDLTTGEETILIPATTENIGYPVLSGDYLFYNSPLNGIDNVYAMELDSRKKYQVTNRRFGGYNPYVVQKDESILFNDFTKDGMALASLPLNPANWTEVTAISDLNVNYYQPLVEGEANPELLKQVPDKKYEEQDYPRGKQMLRVHSWGPLFTTTQSDIEVGVFSQDLLSTTEIAAGYAFDAQELSGRWFGRFSYQQWFPVLDFEVYTGDRSQRSSSVIDTTLDLSWKERGVSVGVRIPLLLTNSKYLQSLSFSGNFIYNRILDYNQSLRDLDQQSDGNLYGMEYSLLWNHLLRRGTRDLYSPWGQRLSLIYRHNPFGGDFTGSLGAAQAWGYFPGLFMHHHFWVRGGYQYQDVQNYRWRSPVFYPRGYGYIPYKHFRTVAFNYSLPLWYPDIALGPVINFQRVWLNGFFDTGRGSEYIFSQGGLQDDAQIGDFIIDYRSYGAELNFDVNLFRSSPLFQIGLRYTNYRSFDETTWSNRVEVLLSSFSF